MTGLRPNTARVRRRGTGSVGLTGNPDRTPSTIYTALPCRISPNPMSQIQFKDDTGVQVSQTDWLIVDGLVPSQFVGTAPGGSLTVNGVLYKVAANGLGAFPDIKPYDQVQREDSTTFLVLTVDVFAGVKPTLQARLSQGKAWQ